MATSRSSIHWAALIYVLCLAWASGSNAARGRPSGNGSSIPSLTNVTVDDLATGLEAGRFTSVDLVKAYLARIDQLNPVLHAVTEVNPDAIAIARDLDEQRRAGNVIGRLHGIPLLLKNNIATMDKMNNTAGSFALLGATVPRDAGVVKKLRAAGVIILGKANLSQWSNFRSQNFTNGWSAHGGQVIGAYYPQQDPRGSSSGSAVAADVGLALGSLATDTVGSLLSPSDMNNLVGIKPTVGLTSRSMVIPVSQRQDSVGPMARTVKDAAYILSAIAGKDEYDNYTSAIPYDPLPDYVKACVPSALRGARIGIPRNAMPADNYTGYILAAFEVAVKVIGDAGATIVDNANYSAYEEFHRRGNPQLVLAGDFASDLPERYLSKLVTNPSNVSSLADVAAFTKAERREEYPERDTANWDRALRAGINNTAPEFWAAYQDNLRFGGAGGVLGALERDNLDVLLLPTYASPELPALVGYPVVTVPLGFHGPDQPVVKSTPRLELVVTAPNIPFGISFLGRPWSEEKLISYAYAFEQLTQARNKAPPHVVSPTGLADMSGIS